MKIEKINELFARFAGQLLKKRWMVLGIFVLVLVLSMIGMKRMVKETSFDDYFIEGDPMLVMTDEFKSHFGNDYYVGVLTQCDNHFTKENLTTLRISKELLHNTLALQTFAYVDVTYGGVFNRLSADYAVNDQLHAIVGYDFFHADSGSFTIYKKNSELFVKLKYSF